MSIGFTRHLDSLDRLLSSDFWSMQGRRLALILGIRIPSRAVLSPQHIETAQVPSRSVVIIELPKSDVFVARRKLPVAHRRHQLAVLRHSLPSLAPIDPQLLETAIATTETGEATGYEIAMARAGYLDELEAAAAKRSMRIAFFRPAQSDKLKLTTRRIRRANSARLAVQSVIVMSSILACLAVSFHVAEHIRRDTESMAAQYEATRTAALELERARHEANVSNALLSRGVLERRPGVVLSDLAEINSALPDSAFLTTFRWTPDRLTLEGITDEGVVALQRMATSAERWRLDAAGSVRVDASVGGQRFELQAIRRSDDQ